MTTYFTICSNNYLAQAMVLGASIRRHIPSAEFIIVLADRKTSLVDYGQIPFEVLAIESFEPRAAELAAKYDIIEFNTCIKPRVFEYLFVERGADRVVYLDPDIRAYGAMPELERALDTANVVITPHVLTPIPMDGKGPSENHILRFGVYNFGFIAMKQGHEALALSRWWKERTYEAGYSKPDAGMFVDQIYGNLMVVFFKGVSMLDHPGYNMAPWNLHERVLSRAADGFLVNGAHRLIFYHFSSFKIDSGELPLHYYNRYTMRDRPDLVDLHAAYNDELKNAGYQRFRSVPWAYARQVTPSPFDGLRRSVRTAGRVGITWAIKVLPDSVTDGVYQTLRAHRT